MKHAVISYTADSALDKKQVEFDLTDECKAYLTESEYTREELDIFRAEESKWKFCCSGSRYFLADSDSGEDAEGYYCGYFDPVPEKAVFDNGKLVGFYLCTDGMRYSGRGRSTFDVDEWGYPGDDPFKFVSWGASTHVFLFDEEETLRWKDWSLLVREPGKEYRSYIDF